MAKRGRPPINKLDCIDCTSQTKKLLPEKEFYKCNDHPDYADRNYRLPICKECMRKRVYRTSKKKEVLLEEFQLVLRKINMPFLYTYYLSAKNSNADTLGSYLSFYNLNQNKGKTWGDSVFDDKNAENNEKLMKSLASEQELQAIFDEENRVQVLPGLYRYKDTLIHKYGEDFDMKFILKCERKYIELHNQVELETAIDRENFIAFIITAVRYREAQANEENSRNIEIINKEFNRMANKIKFTNTQKRSQLLSVMMKKAEEHNGHFDFVKYGFTEEPLDNIDKAIFLLDKLNKRNQDMDNGDYDYKQLYANIRKKIMEDTVISDDNKKNQERQDKKKSLNNITRLG